MLTASRGDIRPLCVHKKNNNTDKVKLSLHINSCLRNPTQLKKFKLQSNVFAKTNNFATRDFHLFFQSLVGMYGLKKRGIENTVTLSPYLTLEQYYDPYIMNALLERKIKGLPTVIQLMK